MEESAEFNLNDTFTFYDENHSRFMLQRINELRSNGVMCDVVIKVEDAKFFAHKNVLSATSGYFIELFNGNTLKDKNNEIIVTGIAEETIKSILNFIYTGEITMSWNNIESLLQGAKLLRVKSVKDTCCIFLEKLLNVTNCLEVQRFCKKYVCKSLMKIATNFINMNYFQVSETEEFLEMSVKDLSSLLSNDDIYVESEEKVYESLVRWTNYDLTNRKMYFPELLENIRLPLVSPYYLVDVVEKEELMRESTKCRDLLLDAQHFHMLPERKNAIGNSRTKPRKFTSFQEKLIAIGGNGDLTNFTTAFAFNVITNEWSELPKLPENRGYHGVTSAEGQLYITGGFSAASSGETLDTVIRYDVRGRQWHDVPSLKSRRSKHGTVELDGSVYVVGGFDGTSTVNTIESFNLQTNSWKSHSPMPTHRRCLCAVAHKKFIYAIGGHDGSGILNTVARYDTSSDTWNSSVVEPMRHRRSFPCAVVSDNNMYVLGGYDGNDTLQSVEMYNFSTNQWTLLPPMIVPRSNAGAAVFNNKIFLVAGWDGVSLNSVECYDIATAEWQQLPPLPRPTTGVRCCFLNFQTSNEQKPKGKSGKNHFCIVC